jgi:drug/metabolite transporter (DMT)-like permease
MRATTAKGVFLILAFCSIVAGILNISNHYHPSEITTHGLPQGLWPGIIYLMLGACFLLIAIFRKKKSAD